MSPIKWTFTYSFENYIDKIEHAFYYLFIKRATTY